MKKILWLGKIEGGRRRRRQRVRWLDSITNSWSLLKLMSIKPVMPSNHLILCHPLLLPPSIFPSLRIFSNEIALRIRWPKYWSFSFSNSPSNEYAGLISFKIEQRLITFHLLALLLISQESCLASQFESINSLALSLRYGPILTSIHEHWKKSVELICSK